MSAHAGLATLTTPRLGLRRLQLDDADFVCELVNGEAFLRFIGDRQVRSAGDARAFLQRSPWTRYAPPGLGMHLVSLRETGIPVGLCGLLQREYLPAPDLGFAFLPAHTGQGYAREAAGAILAWGPPLLHADRILAITDPANTASIRLLQRLGFRNAPLSVENLVVFERSQVNSHRREAEQR